MKHVITAGLTDVGRKRTNNEDHLIVDDTLGLYIVADGMGGHAAGEVASKIVVDTIGEYMNQFRHPETAEELGDPDPALSTEANRLIDGIKLANRSVFHLSEKDPKLHGMGSTVSAVLLTGSSCIAANVGDSPIYLVRNRTAEQLSVYHTLQAEQIALASGQPERFAAGFGHVLTRAMGIDATVKPDISELPLYPDDRIVICSDGLSDKLSADEIAAVVCRRSPRKACSRLITSANDRGGDDNITVIVLQVMSRNKIVFQFQKIVTRIIQTLS